MIETVDLEQQRMSASLPDAEVSRFVLLQPNSALGYKSPRETGSWDGRTSHVSCFMALSRVRLDRGGPTLGHIR